MVKAKEGEARVGGSRQKGGMGKVCSHVNIHFLIKKSKIYHSYSRKQSNFLQL